MKASNFLKTLYRKLPACVKKLNDKQVACPTTSLRKVVTQATSLRKENDKQVACPTSSLRKSASWTLTGRRKITDSKSV